MAVIHLLYVSRASADVSLVDLQDILEKHCNSERGITGALLAQDGRLLQILEGRQDDVLACYHHIEGDGRHAD